MRSQSVEEVEEELYEIIIDQGQAHCRIEDLEEELYLAQVDRNEIARRIEVLDRELLEAKEAEAKGDDD